jgi:hypothetical protein
MVLAGLAALGGLALIAGARMQATSDELGDDELPQPDDFRRELESLGLDADGKPLALGEPRQVIDVLAEPVAAPSKVA